MNKFYILILSVSFVLWQCGGDTNPNGSTDDNTPQLDPISISAFNVLVGQPTATGAQNEIIIKKLKFICIPRRLYC